jgi:membrane-associated phospholipid phosphatase
VAIITAAVLGVVTPAVAGPSPQCGSRPSFGQPFADTLRDIKELPSRETAGWLSVGAAAAIAAHQTDAGVARTFSRSNPLHQALGAGAVIGGTPLQLGAAMATFTIGRAVHRPCAVSVGADLIRAQLLAQGLTLGVKETVRRTRPEGLGFSFPSGHTTASFATATVLQRHFGWKVGVPAYAVATYVAASRVEMRRHYFSDVVFGAALGVVAGRTVTFGTQHRLLLAPMATPGGAGATVTWIGRR